MVARVFQAAYSDDDGSAEEAPYSTKAAGSRQTRLALAEQELGDDDDESEEEEEELDESAQLREPGVASEESEDDEPTTTFAQFVDSDDDDGLGESESESEDNADASSLPLPARTATAKRAGKRKRPNNDGGSDGESSSADDDEEAELKQGAFSRSPDDVHGIVADTDVCAVPRASLYTLWRTAQGAAEPVFRRCARRQQGARERQG